jgi:hypothetical protein
MLELRRRHFAMCGSHLRHLFSVPSALRFVFTAASLVAASRSEAGVAINTPSGLHPGDEFRVAFVTEGTDPASSNDINRYNSFVNQDAIHQNGGSQIVYNGAHVIFSAIASTDSKNAIDNIGIYNVPVFDAQGNALVTPTNLDSSLYGCKCPNCSRPARSISPPGSRGKPGCLDGNASQRHRGLYVRHLNRAHWIGNSQQSWRQSRRRQRFNLRRPICCTARLAPPCRSAPGYSALAVRDLRPTHRSSPRAPNACYWGRSLDLPLCSSRCSPRAPTSRRLSCEIGQ